MSFLIKLDHVTKHYSLAKTTITALRGISLQIASGEMVAIMGASGSGKSTLMNIMGCLDQCSSGDYFFSDKKVSQLSSYELADFRNKKIGFVFQSFFLLPRINALQNVMLPLFYRGLPATQSQAMAMHMLEKLGMAHLAKHKPNQLSGGQQQRVALARALVGDPDVILADEPTGSLDSRTGHDVMTALVDLNCHEGRTIVLITHDEAVSRRCQRVVRIKDGQIEDPI